ncbi:MAG: hypothetical protein GXP08_15825 [Gammaproteobacteria bacterium]|nr:hypothetical protein [Gammaproteobacteria bacterium]
MNLLQALRDSFGMSIDEIEQGLVLRTKKVYTDTYFIDDWIKDAADVPKWVNRAAAAWVVEFWLEERDVCESAQLLNVDKKYTRLLKDFSLSDIIAIRNEVSQVS